MQNRIVAVTALMVAGIVGRTPAQTPNLGTHGSPAVSCRGGAGFVVVWQSRGQDCDDYGIFGQRFDANGAPLGSEFLANSETAERQSHAAVCSNPDGGFVVVWQSYQDDGDDVIGRRFDSTGAPKGVGFNANTYNTAAQSYPSIACDGGGDFVVAWHSDGQDGEDYGIFAQRFDSEGQRRLGSEFQVNEYTSSSQVAPSVSAASNGDFVVVWSSYDDQDGDSYGVFGRRFGNSGNPDGGEFRVNTTTAYSQLAPAVSANAAGELVVAWSSSQDGDDGYGVFGQRYSSTGAGVGSEFHVNTYTSGDQGISLGSGRVLAVAGDDAGDFVAVWQSGGPAQDGDGLGIFGQRFAGTPPAPAGTEFQVNGASTGDQGYPAVCRAPGGGFVVVWESRGDGRGNGIFGQRYESTGSPLGSEFKINSDTAAPPGTCPPPTATPTIPGTDPTATPTRGTCTGDCDRSRIVSVDELVRGVNIALGSQAVDLCRAFDTNGSNTVTVEELISGVNAALAGCGS